ncbi:MAG: NADP-dependent oxidoreductase [Pseudomonadales bacterium]
MSNRMNGQWRLRSRPVGMVREDDFERVDEPVPDLGDNEFLIRNLYLAFEPAMRGWLNDVKSYVAPVQIGEVMRASTVGQVVESRNPEFPEGELVTGMFGWQEYAISDGKPGLMGRIGRVPEGVEPTLMLGALGGTGLTAYFGMLDVGKPGEGDVVVVSGAAGATGSVAGQVARIAGAGKVVGIAGGQRKCRWLVDELGFDAAIDYKSEDVHARLREECPNGIDVFFDNVGGEILDAALLNMALHGRIVLCGGISSYNAEALPPGPSNYMQLVIRRCTMQGFILIDYFDRAPQALEDLARWIAEGRLKHAEDIQEGFENTPRTFLRLFNGENLGKQLLKIADPPIALSAG